MRHSPIRTLHVIPGLDHGGAEWDLVRLVLGLREQGVSSEVVCLKGPGPLVDVLRAHDITTHCLEMHGGMQDLRRLGRLRTLMRASRPDLVQGWLYHGDLASAWAARVLQIPVVWNVRQAHFVPGQSRVTKTLAHVCARASEELPKAIVCCSKASREAHVQMGYDASKIVVIENGIDLDRFYPDAQDRLAVRQEWGTDESTVCFGVVGRLDPAKDIETFFRAFAPFAQTHPHARGVWIGGSEQERSTRAALIKRFGLEEIVDLKSATLGIERELRGLDVLVSSSRSEGFGNVIGEALASGIPCIATRVGAAQEMIYDAKHLVPTEDSHALMDAMAEWYAAGPDAWRDMGRRGRAHIQENFSFQKVVRRYARLYRELL